MAAAPGSFGNLGHNALRGPHTISFDTAVSRIFRINDRYHVQLRMDIFNVFNHVNFAGAISPAGTVTGYATLTTNMSSSSFGRVASAFDPRIIQFALKLNF